ncbi:hypothetical protein C8R47DRAFT_1295169 [Mycena vitilis]|nr:hypothetical protein C8R47DRAFT_1295169 [Mycena vitilis]
MNHTPFTTSEFSFSTPLPPSSGNLPFPPPSMYMSGLPGSSPPPVASSSPTPVGGTSSPAPFVGGAPVLSPLIVDTIARNFSLEARQMQHLRTFVNFGSLGAGLSVPDFATRVFMLAAQFGESAERRRTEQSNDQDRVDFRAIWVDLKIRLEETFCLTRQQKQNIRGIVTDNIYDGSRTKFLTMHVDVLVELKKRQQPLNLDNIFGVPGRVKILSQVTKRQCSSVRNAFRVDLIASIDMKRFTPLAEFVYAAATKYKLGGAGEQLPQSYTVHAVLLRRFVFDNPTLKAVPLEPEEPDSDIEYDEAEEARPRKKAKLAKSRGKLGKAENFWGRMDEWMAGHIAERGSSLTAPKWRSFIDQLLRDDKSKFWGLTPGSPVSVFEPPPSPDDLASTSGSGFSSPPQNNNIGVGDQLAGDERVLWNMMQRGDFVNLACDTDTVINVTMDIGRHSLVFSLAGVRGGDDVVLLTTPSSGIGGAAAALLLAAARVYTVSYMST